METGPRPAGTTTTPAAADRGQRISEHQWGVGHTGMCMWVGPGCHRGKYLSLEYDC